MKTKTQPQHTPIPWKANYAKHADGHVLVDDPALIGPSGEDILPEWSTLSVEDAIFIVRAVNSHEELLSAVKDYLADLTDHTGSWSKERLAQAIAKAEGR